MTPDEAIGLLLDEAGIGDAGQPLLDRVKRLIARDRTSARLAAEQIQRCEMAESAQNTTALKVAREWQEVITILAADTAECLELDINIELKEKRGHPFWWGKVSVLRTLKDMADADVERFS